MNVLMRRPFVHNKNMAPNEPFGSSDNRIVEQLRSLFHRDEWPASETARMIELMALFAHLPPPPDPQNLYPKYPILRDGFVQSIGSDDPEAVEEAFLNLYCHLHGHEAPYTPAERHRVDETGGYWCHAGGLSPILKAGNWIRPGTISADFGAGNGLQTLLMQKLYPHARTIQFEISSNMVACGKQLQNWLGIGEDRVDWIVGDVCDASPRGIDFIYLYRPLKPVGRGIGFYENFARELADSDREVVIFSIADCLKDFLPASFESFYNDGHLTCFRRKSV